MNHNYKPVRQFTDRLLREYYADIEKDLEKIINSPSLLARVSRYYHLITDPDSDMCFLIFTYNGEVWFIREWNVDKFLRHI